MKQSNRPTGTRGLAKTTGGLLPCGRPTLERARDRLQFAVTSGGVGLWDWDLRTNRAHYSPEWKRQIGYEDHEILDGLEEWQSRVHPDDLAEALQKIRACVSRAVATYEVAFRLRHRDGTYRHILSRGSVLADKAGRPARLLGSHVDITERTQLQAQLMQAQKMETVGRLAGGIAHDFNNLLTVINGTADLAMSHLTEGDSVLADLREIFRAGERASALTRHLMGFSRKQILEPSRIDLPTILADMTLMLLRTLGEDIDLVLRTGDGVGPVSADAVQIEQVILNLAVNSRDAMPGGGTLTIEARDVLPDVVQALDPTCVLNGPHVLLAIADTGAGMDEAIRAHLFEPFFTTKAPGRGTGLGLSTVYGIVKQSGGTIRVDTAPGQGTTFRIYLPRVAGIADAIPPAVTAPALPAPAANAETILLVEDEEGVAVLARRMLESSGYTTLVARSGDEALLTLERHQGPVHLVLTDVVMPGMSGPELVTRLAPIRPETRILYTSGHTEDTLRRRSVLDCGTRFIAKPYTRGELTRAVRQVLDMPADRPPASVP